MKLTEKQKKQIEGLINEIMLNGFDPYNDFAALERILSEPEPEEIDITKFSQELRDRIIMEFLRPSGPIIFIQDNEPGKD